jgi:acyltransferase-like protein
MPAQVATLTRLIDNEVIQAMGLSVDGWPGRFLHPLLARATRRFSTMFAEVDRIIAAQGLPAGARWLLLNLVMGFEARGVEHIPAEGPLVIASNHPGTYDSIALATTAKREDLKIIAGAIPFLQNLPNVSRHLIFTPYDDPHARMVVLRKSIQHLRAGGSLLLFARAGIDPDPSFMPQAEEELSNWSRSLEIFLRSVPQTRVVASIVSDVLDPRYMHHPLTWLRRARPDRQRLAMMVQIIQQMLGKKLELVPRVSYGDSIDGASIGDTEHALQSIVNSARQVLHSHLAWQA